MAGGSTAHHQQYIAASQPVIVISNKRIRHSQPLQSSKCHGSRQQRIYPKPSTTIAKTSNIISNSIASMQGMGMQCPIQLNVPLEFTQITEHSSRYRQKFATRTAEPSSNGRFLGLFKTHGPKVVHLQTYTCLTTRSLHHQQQCVTVSKVT